MTIPRWVAWLLRRVAIPGRAEDAIGDLNELHVRRAGRYGRVAASVVSVFSAMDMGVALLRQRMGTPRSARDEPYFSPHGGIGTRREDMGSVIEAWVRDLGQAARSLSRARGFAGVTIVTLALAIGANATIFSVVDAVLLQPLPFADADRLVVIGGTAPGTDLPDDLGVPDELFVEYAEVVPSFEDVALYNTGSSTSRAEGRTEQLFLTGATPSLFSTLGVQPVLGRLPTDEDDDRVTVLSHWLWQDWFGGDPEVVGRSYLFAGQQRTVIGVLPADFRFPDERTAFWIPLVIRPGEVTLAHRGVLFLERTQAPDDDSIGVRVRYFKPGEGEPGVQRLEQTSTGLSFVPASVYDL